LVKQKARAAEADASATPTTTPELGADLPNRQGSRAFLLHRTCLDAKPRAGRSFPDREKSNSPVEYHYSIWKLQLAGDKGLWEE